MASKIKRVATDRLLSSYTCSFIVIFLFGYLHFVFVTNLFFYCVLYIAVVILGLIKTNLLSHEQGNTLQEEPT